MEAEYRIWKYKNGKWLVKVGQCGEILSTYAGLLATGYDLVAAEKNNDLKRIHILLVYSLPIGSNYF